MSIVNLLTDLHDRAFALANRLAGDWFMGLAARLIFASVTMFWFLNSAMTKLDGGLFSISVGAYAQILPPIAEAAGYDPAQIAFFPWKIIVFLGTYTEFILPVILLIGLFTRAASVAMIGFIVVLSFVDIQFHGLEAASIGALFDRFPNGIVADQRLLWLFPLVYLALKGPGPISVDALLAKRFK